MNGNQIPQHAHCFACGKAIKWGDKTCSPKCAAELLENAKKRTQLKWLIYVAMGLAVSLLILQLTGRV